MILTNYQVNNYTDFKEAVMNRISLVRNAGHLTKFLLIILTLLLSSCGEGDDVIKSEPMQSSIASFTTTVSTITNGETTTLTAVFSGGSGVVDNGVGAITSNTAIDVSPDTTTTYTLTVSNTGGATVNKSVVVTVVPVTAPVTAPTITSFSAASSTITSGDTSSLTAVFSDGTGVIDNGIGAVSSSIAVDINPNATTTYTLTVTNTEGVTVTNSVVVTVVPVIAPTITSFSAASSPIASGNTTSLTAVFSDGTGVINNGVGTVSSNIAVDVSPIVTTTYTLTVTNSVGTAITSSVIIAVSTATAETLIIDHNSIALFDQIPQTYINEVKKRLIMLPGESHGRAYGYGLELVEADDSRFNSSTNWSGSAEAYTEQNNSTDR